MMLMSHLVGVGCFAKGLVMHRASAALMNVLMRWGLSFTLLCSVTACSTDEPEPEQIAQAAESASCVLFAGNPHCPMGTASVALGSNGLMVTGMHTAGVDGVSIDLPDVTSFEPKGIFQAGATEATIIARSINQGVSTSTMTTIIGSPGFRTISASFTGSGQGSTYSAVFYRGDQEVGFIAGIPNGATAVPTIIMPPTRPCATCPIVDPGEDPDFFKVRPTGACVWGKTFTRAQAFVMLNGRRISIDKVELVEEVSGSGSYPYLSFNRIEYTHDSGSLLLTGETIH